MANSYKNVVITPNIGSSTDDPKIVFSGANATTNTDIILRTYPTSNGSLSVEGSSGQLFSVTNDLSGTIFSVNDVSGIPSIEVLDTGLLKLAQYSGNVAIGKATANTKVEIQGSITANTLISSNPNANANTYLAGDGSWKVITTTRSLSITDYSGNIISVSLTSGFLNILNYSGSTISVPTV